MTRARRIAPSPPHWATVFTHFSFYISMTYIFSRHPRACPGHPRRPDAAFISSISVMRPDVDPRDKPGDDGLMWRKLLERITLYRCVNPLAHWGGEGRGEVGSARIALLGNPSLDWV